MARIIICDLCKQRIKKDEAGPWGLSLSYCVDNPMATKKVNQRTLEVEICNPCNLAIIERINSDEPPAAFQKGQVEHVPTRTMIAPTGPQDGPLDFSASIGPSVEEKAKRKPTDKLLEDEINVVPTAVNHKKGSRELLMTQRKLEREKGCPHHFKTWEDGITRCGSAPPGYNGEFAGFAGCGKALTEKEL